MKLTFRINYHTEWGQKMYVTGSIPSLGNFNIDQALEMSHMSDGNWEAVLDLPKGLKENIRYHYVLVDVRHNVSFHEEGEERILEAPDKKFKECILEDQWRAKLDVENTFDTTPFTDVIFRRTKNIKKRARKFPGKSTRYQMQMAAPRATEEHVLLLSGNVKELGEWKVDKAVALHYDADKRLWHGQMEFEPGVEVQYKYVLKNKKTGVVEYESGSNRSMFTLDEPGTMVSIDDGRFRYNRFFWKGAGVALPVFSIRTDRGLGIGEFLDIKELVDWASHTGMRLVQILPVNDTVATYSWVDSYPYAAISVFALHPMYINLEAVGSLKSKERMKAFKALRKKLNGLPEVDYETVMNAKMEYLQELWNEKKASFYKSVKVKKFLSEQEAWIKSYAAFCYLRDLNKTPDFSQFGKYAEYSDKKINALFASGSKVRDEVYFHVFIQYHLHEQLLEACEYGRSKGVVLKGDIPIGIYRHSADAWTAPHLYNMNGQAGAPPDDFAVNGQNWGFPTYNWEAMKEDGYQWWRSRLTHLSQYFETFRIDHILGFFRIWEIPLDAVQGLLGQFRPALALQRFEIENQGVFFDEDRFLKPYIRDHFLYDIFGSDTEWVRSHFLVEKWPGAYDFGESFDTQRKVKDYFDGLNPKDAADAERLGRISEELMSLHNEVLLLKALDDTSNTHFAPRITMDKTRSFQELDAHVKTVLWDLYIDYFYRRQEHLWEAQAMEKLPALKEATNMLICGEDLGMVPDCVPGVMKELGILSLEIQRMPKNPEEEFAHPNNYPYMSVATPSTHDMSTIRGWWEEDAGETQRFYNYILGNWGVAPRECEPWIAQEILNQHFYCNSMWAILPLQDMLAMDGTLRRKNQEEERINIPAIKEHYWRYRMHLSMEELMKAEDFNKKLSRMILESGRNTDY